MAKKKIVEEHDVIPDERALVFNQLKEQYALPWEQARGLIRSESMLTEAGVRIALQTAKSFGLPLQGINVLPTKNGPQVYVNADGVRWRLHVDPRGIKRTDTDIIHRPTKDEPWVEVKAIIELGDGSSFVNWGVVYSQPGPDTPNAIMKAVTKGLRRAGVSAVGVALPIYEEYVEWRQEQGKAIEGDFKISDEPKVVTEPTNLAELLSWAGQKGKNVEDILAALGVDDLQMVMNNLPLALSRLKDMWK